MKNIIGVDIGGSSVKAGLVSGGRLTMRASLPTPKNNAEALFQTVFNLIDGILIKTERTAKTIDGIGIGVCGMVKDGILLNAANIELENVNLADTVGGRYNVPVKTANDLACFALAESRTSKTDSLVYIAIGTGVNAGVITDGHLLDGIEYGHTALLDYTVEHYINGKGIETHGISRFLRALEIVLVNIANTYRPKKIFIGGGAAEKVAPHIDRLNQNLKDCDYGYKNAPPVTVEISAISNDGAILGAAALLE